MLRKSSDVVQSVKVLTAVQLVFLVISRVEIQQWAHLAEWPTHLRTYWDDGRNQSKGVSPY